MSNGMAEVSFCDPAGFVYRQQGELRRQVEARKAAAKARRASMMR